MTGPGRLAAPLARSARQEREAGSRRPRRRMPWRCRLRWLKTGAGRNRCISPTPSAMAREWRLESFRRRSPALEAAAGNQPPRPRPAGSAPPSGAPEVGESPPCAAGPGCGSRPRSRTQRPGPRGPGRRVWATPPIPATGRTRAGVSSTSRRRATAHQRGLAGNRPSCSGRPAGAHGAVLTSRNPLLYQRWSGALWSLRFAQRTSSALPLQLPPRATRCSEPVPTQSTMSFPSG